jgi:hypothetical protein
MPRRSDEELINIANARFGDAERTRMNFEDRWQEVSDFCAPDRQFTIKRAPGEQRNLKIYDPTAVEAAITLSAAVEGLMSNGALPWYSIIDADEAALLDEDQEWLYHATQQGLNYLGSMESGWPTSSHEVYLDLVSFGTAVLRPAMRDGMLRWEAKDLAGFYIAHNEAGVVDEAHRVFKFTITKAAEVFGPEALHPETREKLGDPTKSGEEIEIRHSIMPNRDRQFGRMDGDNKKWYSVYQETKKKHVLRRGGFNEFPYLVPRWSKRSEEVYGTSPAMRVMPAIRTVQAITKTNLMAGQLATMPPLTVPAGVVQGPVDTAPGSIITIKYSAATAGARPEPLITGARPDIGDAMGDRFRAMIEKAFFVDVLRLPELDRMTATEVIERRQQGLMAASPVLTRLYAELLNHVVMRTTDFLIRIGRIRPMPDSMRRRRAKIRYKSPLAISQSAARNNAVLATLAAAEPIIRMKPEVLDRLDADQILGIMWDDNGANPNMLRSLEETIRIRQARDQQQQDMAQSEMIRQDAGAMKDAAAALQGLGVISDGG